MFLRTSAKMLVMLLKSVVGKKVTLLKKVQIVIMFLGAATVLLLQVSSVVININLFTN